MSRANLSLAKSGRHVHVPAGKFFQKMQNSWEDPKILETFETKNLLKQRHPKLKKRKIRFFFTVGPFYAEIT